MATFQQLMRAAENAENAGDSDGARQLVQMAQTLVPKGAKPTVANAPMQPVAYNPSQNVDTRKPDTFGPTIRAATEGPKAALRAYSRGLVDQEQSPSMANMPDWVPERLRPAAARVSDAAMTGLAGLGYGYSLGAGTAGEILGGSPTNEKRLARDLMMAGEVALPQLAGASSVANAAAKGAKAAGTLAAEPTAIQAAARAADELEITPSLGAGGKVRAMTAATLEKTPIVGGRIEADNMRFVGEAEGAFDRIVGKVGAVDGAVGAGEALQKGLRQFVGDFRTKSAQLYSKVGEAIPPNTKIQSPKTIEAIREAASMFADQPAIMKELGVPRWLAIADDLEEGISWQAATALRSSIGNSIGKASGALTDMDQARLKQIYGTLTEDLEAAAVQAGPKAESAWKRANTYYRRGAERIDQQLDRLITADSPERAIELFVAATKDQRSTSNSKRLFAVKSSMPSQEWDKVAASVIDRLGRAKPGAQNAEGNAFSINTFLTEYNKLSPAAKSALLKGDARKEMEQLAKVAEIGKAANAERNVSNTGNVVAGASLGAALFSAPVTTTLAVGSGVGVSRAMTSPVFLRALNRAARGDQRALRRIAQSNNEFAEDARTILAVTSAENAGTIGAANQQGRPAGPAVRREAR